MTILETEGNTQKVKFKISVIKDLEYVNEQTFEEGQGVLAISEG